MTKATTARKWINRLSGLIIVYGLAVRVLSAGGTESFFGDLNIFEGGNGRSVGRNRPSGSADSTTPSGGVEIAPGEWVNPLPPGPDGKPQLGRNWGQKRGYETHWALDIPVPEGTPVYAPQKAWVEFARTTDAASKATGSKHESGIYVQLFFKDIVLDDPRVQQDPSLRLEAQFMHLSRLTPKTFAYDLRTYKTSPIWVEPGELIGWSGKTGVYNSGAHLHLNMFLKSLNDRSIDGPRGSRRLHVDPRPFLRAGKLVGAR